MPSVLITGASRGIGRSAAFAFAEAGWDLILLSRSEASLQSLATELASTGQRIVYGAVDLTKPEEIAPGVATLLSQGLTPSVLINNAGAAWTGGLLEMPLDRWNWLMQLNLTSVFQMCAAVVPAMRTAGGLVINISSHAARNAFPNWGDYCTVKAALASFTRCLAEEERAHGIRACTLTLGGWQPGNPPRHPYRRQWSVGGCCRWNSCCARHHLGRQSRDRSLESRCQWRSYQELERGS